MPDTQRGAGGVRIHAMYLPQFHPVPENNQWWGTGFTEWTNTAKAKPLFRTHRQPRIPADLGFYDLRVPETRAAQASLAKRFGIEGFVYYHYWFGGGKRLLQRPFEEVVASGEPDFPFSLCWANQTWTGVWHGEPNRVLIKQTYPGIADVDEHFYCLLDAFHDRRYTRVDGKPLFMIFDPPALPDAKRFIDRWRELAASNGLDGIYFVASETLPNWNAASYGYDATTSYPLPPLERPAVSRRNPLAWLRREFKRRQRPTRYSFRKDLELLMPRWGRGPLPHHPTTIHAWDNTPRSGMRGLVLEDSSPEAFRPILRRAFEISSLNRPMERFVFLKSWNEWAEGNYLEPDRDVGTGYLEVIASEAARFLAEGQVSEVSRVLGTPLERRTE